MPQFFWPRQLFLQKEPCGGALDVSASDLRQAVMLRQRLETV